MKYCSACGGKLIPLTTGGCGGCGGLDGCSACDRVFVQTSGGILASPGGESFSVSNWNYKELCWHLAKDSKIDQSTHKETWDKKPNPTYGQWYWAEIGFGETHYYATRDEAETQLQAYIQQLKNQLGWPRCDLCGQMAEKISSHFQCVLCDQTYLKEGFGYPAMWVKSDLSNIDEKVDQIKAAKARLEPGILP